MPRARFLGAHRSGGALDQQHNQSSSDEEQREKTGRLERAKDRIDRAISQQREWVERERDRRPSVRIVVGSIELDQRTGGSLLAGGLAYRLFLWLLPFGLFSSVLIGMVSDAGDRPVSSVARDLGMSAAMRASISDAIGATDSGQVWFLLLGATLMLVSARGVWKALRLASGLAWDVRPERSRSWWKAALGTTLFACSPRSFWPRGSRVPTISTARWVLVPPSWPFSTSSPVAR